MCGRYNVIDDPFMAALLASLDINLSLATRFNIAPTEQVPVIIERQGLRQVNVMRWWLLPPWATQLNTKYASFNARCETVASSKLFSRPFKAQRALMPVSAFIEWQKMADGKQAQLISAVDGALAFAALYETCTVNGQELQSCAIITRPASDAFSAVHSRMPVMLSAAQVEEWLDPCRQLEADYSAFSTPIERLQLTPISSQVNNTRNKASEDQQAIGDTWYLH